MFKDSQPPEFQRFFRNKNWYENINFFEDDFESNQQTRDLIKERLTKENFLGEGGAAKVYDIGETRCIKLMENRHNSSNRDMYDLGNNANTEAQYLAELSDFSHEGVRTPVAYGYYTGEKGMAIVMEKMDATNLQDALNNKANFPENFDFELFYDQLYSYIEEMHAQKGIAHGDLFPRNVMIDNETGRPIVIDFGRAKRVNKEKARTNDDKTSNQDLEMLEDKIYEELDKYFNKT